MVILDSESKLRTGEDVDKVIKAVIPDKEKCPRLYEIVTSHMIHNPCGEHNPEAPCMIEDKNGNKICCWRARVIYEHNAALYSAVSPFLEKYGQ